MIIHGYTAWILGVLALYAALMMFRDGLEAIAGLIEAHVRRRDQAEADADTEAAQ